MAPPLGLRQPRPRARHPRRLAPPEGAARPRPAAGRELRGAHPAPAARGRARRWSALLQFYPTYAQEAGVPQMVAATFASLGRWDQLISVGEAHVNSPSLPDAERARLSSLLCAPSAARASSRARSSTRSARSSSGRAARGPSSCGSGRCSRGSRSRRAGARGARQPARGAGRGRRRRHEPHGRRLGLLHGRRAPGGGGARRARALDGRDVRQRVPPARLAAAGRRPLRGRRGQPAEGVHAHAAHVRAAAPGRRGRRHGGALLRGRRLPAERRVGEGRAAARQPHRLLPRAADADRQRRRRRPAGRSRTSGPARRPASATRRPSPPRLVGDDTTYFVQTARLHAVQGRTQDALRELAQGLSLGHGELQHVRDDPDFESLRGTPDFRRLVVARPPSAR